MSKNRPVVGILTFQGAVQEHIAPLAQVGAEYRLVRLPEELEGLDALIIPGGESTVIHRFLHRYGMIAPMRAFAQKGHRIWGICAGAIVLATNVDGEAGKGASLLEIQVRRNDYGRQLASGANLVFSPEFLPTEGAMMPFIRAPRFAASQSREAKAIATRENGEPVGFIGGSQENILATAFHPELTDVRSFHAWVAGATLSRDIKATRRQARQGDFSRYAPEEPARRCAAP
ncbi:pyridoxal 5'-phosphate synthase glutaminase subunit PdxT [Sediminispirochaeta smaragdinae]|uniref:glutaminase n=1 Tax=Sediminispirochaeta smaragdinae (strain DSM 11293 / JCM 15392 / SEBR 4228) TaxID=573413 RepID=E1R7R6_SEDSS|nr:pyridoxal 5'-phosphate synthase glutaminase subunit PdxT [Sediminispirochaeta smaragdinae]ADK82771.1 SNO glutamine amidotransferase [Sediminispirochaeta smaragdinae DSM 11293]